MVNLDLNALGNIIFNETVNKNNENTQYTPAIAIINYVDNKGALVKTDIEDALEIPENDRIASTIILMIIVTSICRIFVMDDATFLTTHTLQNKN